MDVPFDYWLYRLGKRIGLQPWVFEGYPPDQPPLVWLLRVFEFARLEASVKVSKRG